MRASLSAAVSDTSSRYLANERGRSGRGVLPPPLYPHALRAHAAIPSILGACCAVAARCFRRFDCLGRARSNRGTAERSLECTHRDGTAILMAVGAHRQFTSGGSARRILSRSRQYGRADAEPSSVWDRVVLGCPILMAWMYGSYMDVNLLFWLFSFQMMKRAKESHRSASSTGGKISRGRHTYHAVVWLRLPAVAQKSYIPEGENESCAIFYVKAHNAKTEPAISFEKRFTSDAADK